MSSKINRKFAMKFWNETFGKQKQIAKDFSGREIRKGSYGDEKSKYSWSLDHIYPKSLGGKDSNDNLQIVHSKTNLEKSDKLDFEIEGKKFRVVEVKDGIYEVKDFTGIETQKTLSPIEMLRAQASDCVSKIWKKEEKRLISFHWNKYDKGKDKIVKTVESILNVYFEKSNDFKTNLNQSRTFEVFLNNSSSNDWFERINDIRGTLNYLLPNIFSYILFFKNDVEASEEEVKSLIKIAKENFPKKEKEIQLVMNKEAYKDFRSGKNWNIGKNIYKLAVSDKQEEKYKQFGDPVNL